MEEQKKLESKSNASQRAASQHVESSVAKFMETLYLTKESPCYHNLSDEMYETGLIFYVILANYSVWYAKIWPDQMCT